MGDEGDEGEEVELEGDKVVVVIEDEEEEEDVHKVVKKVEEGLVEARVEVRESTTFEKVQNSIQAKGGRLVVSVTNRTLNCSFIVNTSIHGDIVST